MKGKRIENLPPDYLSRLAAQKGSGREKMLTLLRVAGDFGVHSSTIRNFGISGHPSERARELEAKGFEIERKREYIDGRNGVRFYLLSEPAVKLTAGVSAGVPKPQGTEGLQSAPERTSAHPGEPQRRPTDAPSPKGADRSVHKPEPVPSVGKDAGAGSGVTSPHALEPAPRTLSLLPDPDPETWAA